MLCKYLLLATAVLSANVVLKGATWYVSTNGSDVNNGTGGWAQAFFTISNAVTNAAANDVVLVSNGVYQLSAQLNIPRVITLRSLNGKDVTTIRGDFPNTMFRCLNISANAIVEGFTVANGWLTGAASGAGVLMTAGILRDCRVASNYITDTSSSNIQCGGAGIYVGGAVVVSNCIVEDNVMTNSTSHIASGGGGIHMYNSNGLVVGSTIRNNICTNSSPLTGRGGGILVRAGQIFNCQIISNNASGRGGGIMMSYAVVSGGRGVLTGGTVAGNFSASGGGGASIEYDTGQLFFISNVCFRGNISQTSGGGVYLGSLGAQLCNCFIYSNSANTLYGGGIYLASNCASIVESCTIVNNNSASSGGGIYMQGNGADILRNSIVFGNTNLSGANNIVLGDSARKVYITYSCFPEADGTWGEGNITSAPAFCDSEYRHYPYSPCVNAGSNVAWMVGNFDLDGRPRIDRITRRVDMGCYEYFFRGSLVNIK